MTKFEDNLSPYLTVVEQGSTPANPSAGDQKLFVKTSDHLLYFVNSSGTVTAVGGAGAAFSGARAFNSANISLTNGGYTTITLDSETYDTDSYHSLVSATERMTIAATGKYAFGCGIAINSSLTTWCFVELVKNVGPTALAIDSRSAVSGSSTNITVASEALLTAGDYIWVRVFANNAGSSAIVNGDFSPVLWIERRA